MYRYISAKRNPRKESFREVNRESCVDHCHLSVDVDYKILSLLDFGLPDC